MGVKSERWSGSRAFGEKCSHSIPVRGHPGKSQLVETKKGALMTRNLISKMGEGLRVTAFVFSPARLFLNLIHCGRFNFCGGNIHPAYRSYHPGTLEGEGESTSRLGLEKKSSIEYFHLLKRSPISCDRQSIERQSQSAKER